MRTFWAAVTLLSVFPVGRFLPTEKEMRNVVNFYPAAGVLFALIFWGAAHGALYCPTAVAAMLAAILPEALTKGFHLDGLADTADAFLSGRSRERKLEIMRDSHIGTMGVAAIFALLGLKFALFSSAAPILYPALAGMMILGGRCAIVWYIAFSRYARKEGLGKLSFETKPSGGLVSGSIFLLGAGYLFFGAYGLLYLPFCVLAMFLWSRITARVIGGATGDTIGAAEELAELLFLAAAVCLSRLFFPDPVL